MKKWAVLLGFLAFIGMSMAIAATAADQEVAAPPAVPEVAAPPAVPEVAAPPAVPEIAAPPAAPEAAAPEGAAAAVVVREAGAAAYPDGLVHTVVEGDTLWDLSAKYLGSPWRWPELWAQNRFLTNPHFIYPGVKVVIFPPPAKAYSLPAESAVPKAEAAVPKAEAPAPAPAPEVVPTLRITPAEFVRGGEFLSEMPRGIGKIADGEVDKVAFSEGDVVYLSLDKDLPAGQLLGVYRIRGPVSVPGAKGRSGYAKYLVGVVQISGKSDGTVKGKIRKSFEDLLRTDILTEEIPSYAPVVIRSGGAKLESLVITGRSENKELATGDFVYLDTGSDAGVAVGDVFTIYMDRYQDSAGAGPATGGKIKVRVGRAVVTKANRAYATAYVDESLQSFESGDHAIRGAAQSP